jgi:hypothetical protein
MLSKASGTMRQAAGALRLELHTYAGATPQKCWTGSASTSGVKTRLRTGCYTWMTKNEVQAGFIFMLAIGSKSMIAS